MSVCGNGSHPRPDAKSLQAADSGRGGQEPAGHHCAPSAAVSAPPRCGVMMRKGVAREIERERERESERERERERERENVGVD